jgi:hypothetical protein
MNADRLWMEEDELRAELEVMDARLFLASMLVRQLMDRVEDAARDGYISGYSDAALRVSRSVAAGDQGCVTVH